MIPLFNSTIPNQNQSRQVFGAAAPGRQVIGAASPVRQVYDAAPSMQSSQPVKSPVHQYPGPYDTVPMAVPLTASVNVPKTVPFATSAKSNGLARSWSVKPQENGYGAPVAQVRNIEVQWNRNPQVQTSSNHCLNVQVGIQRVEHKEPSAPRFPSGSLMITKTKETGTKIYVDGTLKKFFAPKNKKNNKKTEQLKAPSQAQTPTVPNTDEYLGLEPVIPSQPQELEVRGEIKDMDGQVVGWVPPGTSVNVAEHNTVDSKDKKLITVKSMSGINTVIGTMDNCYLQKKLEANPPRLEMMFECLTDAKWQCEDVDESATKMSNARGVCGWIQSEVSQDVETGKKRVRVAVLDQGILRCGGYVHLQELRLICPKEAKQAIFAHTFEPTSSPDDRSQIDQLKKLLKFKAAMEKSSQAEAPKGFFHQDLYAFGRTKC